MLHRFLAGFVCMVFFLGVASASMFYNGHLAVQLEKKNYSAGETLKGALDVSNFEQVAFNDSYIVLELVSGNAGALDYPSQFKDDGVLFLEKKIGVKLPGGQQKKIGFEIPLPKNLAGGTYTLDAYFVTKRTPIVGIPHIFASPISTEFEVSGTGDFPQLNIVRTKTLFNRQAGPVGPPSEPSADIKGEVFVMNGTKKTLKNITVWAGLCNWDDTSCEKFSSEDSKKIDVAANGETKVELALKAPELPGAYAIRIEAREEGNRVVSLYRNRAIVIGPTGRIKKLDVSTQKLEPEKEVSINLLLGASPDHYTDPDFNDFDLKAWVEKQGAKLFEKTEHVDSLPFVDIEREYKFLFVPQTNSDSFKVCSSVVKGTTIMDEYCFDVEPIEVQAQALSSSRGRVEVDYSYSVASGKLQVSVCGFDKDNLPEAIDIALSLLELGSGKKIADSQYAGSECYSDSVPVENSKYLLIVDDFRNASQFSRELDFSARQQSLSCTELGGVLCAEGEQCIGEKAGGNNACCKGSCEAAGKVAAGSLEPDAGALPIIVGALAVLVLLVAFILGRKRTESEEQ